MRTDFERSLKARPADTGPFTISILLDGARADPLRVNRGLFLDREGLRLDEAAA